MGHDTELLGHYQHYHQYYLFPWLFVCLSWGVRLLHFERHYYLSWLYERWVRLLLLYQLWVRLICCMWSVASSNRLTSWCIRYKPCKPSYSSALISYNSHSNLHLLCKRLRCNFHHSFMERHLRCSHGCFRLGSIVMWLS